MNASSCLRTIIGLAFILATARCASPKDVRTAPAPELAESYLANASEFAANSQFDGANFYQEKDFVFKVRECFFFENLK